MYDTTGSISRRYAYYGMGSGPILLSDLYCTGTESNMLECNRNMYGTLSCSHNQDAGVRCEGECFGYCLSNVSYVK